MKFFLDTAQIDEIRTVHEWGLLDGVTTNPSLAKAAGRKFADVIAEIAALVGERGTVSAETISPDAAGIVREARLVTSWAPNIVAKVAFGLEGLKAVRQLTDEGLRCNVTLVFSGVQGLAAMKAGAYYISPFVGRLDDQGQDGMELVRELVEIKHNYGFETSVLAASLRGTMHVLQAALAGADIATLPFGVLEKSLQHPLTTAGLERFLKDWAAMPAELKPF